MKYSKILSEIANPIRTSILLNLYDNNLTVSELKEKIGDISHSEISRHIGRLAEHKLITKESIPGRKYELTHFGAIIVKLLMPIDFILKNSDYFKTHRIDDIPEELLQGLENLGSSEHIIGTGNLMVKGKTFIESAMKDLWIMTNDPFPYEIKVKHANLIIPPHMLKYGFEVDHIRTKYDVKLLPEVHVCIILSDLGQGFIFLPNLTSSAPDFSEGFFIKDSKGYEYLKRMFFHFWEISKEFTFTVKNGKISRK
jgi:DNA-binding transcriptional ArsR family regulator